MTLLDAILAIDIENIDNIRIDYRTIFHFSDGFKEDTLIGYCYLVNDELYSGDGDSYSLLDTIKSYDLWYTNEGELILEVYLPDEYQE